MKKKKTAASRYLSRSYGPLVLWLDDLEDFVARLQTHSREITIETDEYQFDSIAELSEQFGHTNLKTLNIATYAPYVSLELTPMWAKLSVDGIDKNASGTFFDLNRILESHQRRFPWLYLYWFILTFAGISWVPSSWFPPEIHYDWFRIALLPFVIWVIWVCYVRVKRHCLIHLELRAKAKSFFQRNRDQLAVAIIAALIGAVLGGVGIKLADKISSVPSIAESQPNKN